MLHSLVLFVQERILWLSSRLAHDERDERDAESRSREPRVERVPQGSAAVVVITSRSLFERTLQRTALPYILQISDDTRGRNDNFPPREREHSGIRHLHLFRG
jgi:hypothetical protein